MRRRRRRRTRLGDARQEKIHGLVLRALRDVEKAKTARDCRGALSAYGEAKMWYGAAAENSLTGGATLDVRNALHSLARELSEARERIATRCLVRA